MALPELQVLCQAGLWDLNLCSQLRQLLNWEAQLRCSLELQAAKLLPYVLAWRVERALGIFHLKHLRQYAAAFRVFQVSLQTPARLQAF